MKYLILSVMIFTFSGCARMELDRANLSTTVQMNKADSSKYEIKKHFKETAWNHYFLLKMTPTSKHNLQEMISPHVGENDIVVNANIKKQTTLINGLICTFAVMIYCPDQLIVEGDVAAPLAK